MESHAPSPEPVAYEKKDGQWYGHDGVDVKETQQRKGTDFALHNLDLVVLIAFVDLFRFRNKL